VAKVVSLDNLKETPEHVGGWIARARRFLADVRAELGRVTWPSRREVWATTIVVIVVSLVFGIYLFSVDAILNAAVRWVFAKVGS
jgi:preprotein translocase subunit SecE